MTRSMWKLTCARTALVILLSYSQYGLADEPSDIISTLKSGVSDFWTAFKGGKSSQHGASSADPASTAKPAASSERPESAERIYPDTYKIALGKYGTEGTKLKIKNRDKAGKVKESTFEVKSSNAVANHDWLLSLRKFRDTLKDCSKDSFEAALAKWMDKNLITMLDKPVSGSDALDVNEFSDKLAEFKSILKEIAPAFKSDKGLAEFKKSYEATATGLEKLGKEIFTELKETDAKKVASSSIPDFKTEAGKVRDAIAKSKDNELNLCVSEGGVAPSSEPRKNSARDDDSKNASASSKGKGLGERHGAIGTEPGPVRSDNQPTDTKGPEAAACPEGQVKGADGKCAPAPIAPTKNNQAVDGNQQVGGFPDGNLGGLGANNDLNDELRRLLDDAELDRERDKDQFNNALDVLKAQLALQNQNDGNNRDVQIRSAETAPQQQQQPFLPQQPLLQQTPQAAPVAAQPTGQGLPDPNEFGPQQGGGQPPMFFPPPMPTAQQTPPPTNDTPRFQEPVPDASQRMSVADIIAAVRGASSDPGRGEADRLMQAMQAGQAGMLNNPMMNGQRPNAYGSRASALSQMPARPGVAGLGGMPMGFPTMSNSMSLGGRGPVGATGPLPSALQNRFAR